MSDLIVCILYNESAHHSPSKQDVREDSDAERDPGGGTLAAAAIDGGRGGRMARKQVSFSAALAAEAGRVDDTYFDSYSYLDIHREMLGDQVGWRVLPEIFRQQLTADNR